MCACTSGSWCSEVCCPGGPRLPPSARTRGARSAWAAGGRLGGGLAPALAPGWRPGGPTAVRAQGRTRGHAPRPRPAPGRAQAWRPVCGPGSRRLGSPPSPPHVCSLCALVLEGAIFLAQGPTVVRKVSVPPASVGWPVRSDPGEWPLPLGEVGAGVRASFPRPSWEGDASPRPRAGHEQAALDVRPASRASLPAAPAGLGAVGSGRCEDGPSASCPPHPRAVCLLPPEQLGRTQVPGATARTCLRGHSGRVGARPLACPTRKEGAMSPP